MNRIELKHIAIKPRNPFAGFAPVAHRLLFGLFLSAAVVVGARLWRPGIVFGSSRWPEGLLVLLSAASSLTTLLRLLPGQNVLAVSVLVAVMAGGVQCLGAFTGIPFGPYAYTEHERVNPLPLVLPLVWLVILLNARGVARLVLRPWRESFNYGYWLLAASVFLVVLMDFGFEPFATIVNNYWIWKPTLIASTWYGAPWVNFLGWAVSALIILAFATPFLINKKPVQQAPDFCPLIVWTVFNLLFLTGAIAHQLHFASALIAGHTLAVLLLALLGARRKTARPELIE